jgi:hypothetical protein
MGGSSMNQIINLADERRQRERLTIALAGAAYETMYACPEDPTPMPVCLAELAAEAEAWTLESVNFDYRCVVALRKTPPGGEVDLNAYDPEPYHGEVLRWAIDFLNQIRSDFGTRFRGGRA